MGSFIEIFTLVTGVVYIVLEIRQKNLMWAVGVLTSVAAMWVFFRQGLYASFALNTYYLVTSFIGLWQWRMDKCKLAEVRTEQKGDKIHLNRPTRKTMLISCAIIGIGFGGLGQIMNLLGNPMSFMDSAVAVMSAIATWWLVRSYLEQWLIWILADGLSVAICIHQGLWWMAALYAAYALSAVYGYYHWKKNGVYIQSGEQKQA